MGVPSWEHRTVFRYDIRKRVKRFLWKVVLLARNLFSFISLENLMTGDQDSTVIKILWVL